VIRLKVLLQQVGYIRQQCHLASTLDGLRNLALIFQRVTGNAARQHLALLIEELLQEFCVFVIDVADAIIS